MIDCAFAADGIPGLPTGKLFCRHEKIRPAPFVVAESVCGACHWRNMPSAATRPIPDKIEPPKPVSLECQHRRLQIGLTPCPTCRGSVVVKLFACQIHGPCVIRAVVDGAKTCPCPDQLLPPAG